MICKATSRIGARPGIRFGILSGPRPTVWPDIRFGIRSGIMSAVGVGIRQSIWFGTRPAVRCGIRLALLALLCACPFAPARAAADGAMPGSNEDAAPNAGPGANAGAASNAGPGTAVMMTVAVNNKTSRAVRVCLNYKTYPETGWITQGWWTVRASDNALFAVPSNNAVAYFFAADTNGGPGWWGGKTGEPDAIRRAVIHEDFRVPDGEKPKGKKYRTVTMQRIRADDRVFVINLSGS